MSKQYVTQEEMIQDVLSDWSQDVVKKLMEMVQKKNLVVTAELLRSFQFEVLRATGTHSGSTLIAFEQYGRMREMKRTSYSKMPPIEVIEEWVKKIGPEKFNYTPGQWDRVKPLTEDKRINRIAWGVAISMRQGNQRKPVKWYSKTFYGMINALMEDLSNNYSQMAVQAIQENGSQAR